MSKRDRSRSNRNTRSENIFGRASDGIQRVETFIDRTIGIFNPNAELDRLRARNAAHRIRNYDAASRGRRTSNWNTGDAYVNDLLKGGLPVLRARSRDLTRNNPWANKALDVIVNNTIGRGIRPQPKGIKSEAKKIARLSSLWDEWGQSVACDADGMLDFYGLQALVMRTVAESGSCIIRRRRRRSKDNLAVPFQLQVLEPDYLDTTKDTQFTGNNNSGNRIVQGIEYDRLGRRVAYHLYSEHPGSNVFNMKSNRIPAEDISHVFKVERAGQADGIPWGASIIIRVKDLDEYEDADLIRQKIAACFVGVVTKLDEDEAQTTDPTKKEQLERFEPGMFEYLSPGEEISFSSPPPNPDTNLPTRALRSIAAGYGITYESLTGDYSQVNFSSGRMGHLEMNRNLEGWRHHMMIPQFCVKTWNWFNEGAILSGAVSKRVPATWTPPRREMIDPVKETNAKKTQVRAGFKSWSEAIKEDGRDPDEVLEEISRDYEKMREKSLPLEAFPGFLPDGK